MPYVLLEREAEVGAQPRAGAVEHRTVELLRREGIADEVVPFSAQNHECEFRTADDSVVLDYGRLTGGRPHYIHPQHRLVRELHAVLDPAYVRCGHTVERVLPSDDGVTLRVTGPDGSRIEMECDVAVGCEGSHSAVAAAMSGLSIMEQWYDVRWLATIAAAPPLEPRTIYAAHPRGFAGQMRRDPTHTRYLEVPASDTAEGWPVDRIRGELATRLGVGDRLDGVPFDEVGFLDLRGRMVSPMQQGPLFLAGDAAHLITPAGGKGMTSPSRMPSNWPTASSNASRAETRRGWTATPPPGCPDLAYPGVLELVPAGHPRPRRRGVRDRAARRLGRRAEGRSAAGPLVRPRLRRRGSG